MKTAKKQTTKRQHFIARFYLRNFADPMFSENLQVYDIKKKRWERRTPDGVGWFKHLCSTVESDGSRNDNFDKFLEENVEQPAVGPMKRLAMADSVVPADRPAIAKFIALTAARNPDMINGILGEQLLKASPEKTAEDDDVLAQWCQWTNRRVGPDSRREFFKPGVLGAMWLWSQRLQQRLLGWEWHQFKTTRNQPFITSDATVFAEWDRTQDLRLVTFPISAERALVIIAGGKLNPDRDISIQAQVLNRQAFAKATRFVASPTIEFPGDAYLPT